ncbi:MAG: hypothetical protein ACRC6M_01785, partial [Microcystaceae cyanobacterium]
LLILLALLLEIKQPAIAATKCSPLMAVGGEKGQTVVNKRATAPSIPIGLAGLKRDNWNTDFAVKNGIDYKQFITTFIPKTDGTYSIRVYLKYSDGTADEIYNEKPNLSSAKPLIIKGTPRQDEQPYQVNIFVGDAESLGKSYQISVKACSSK